MELFIPSRIGTDDKYGKGIGPAEMRRLLIFIVVGLLIGTVTALCFFNDNLQTILVTIVFVGALFAIIGYYISQRNSINLSVYHYISLMLEFYKHQRFFKYNKVKEW